MLLLVWCSVGVFTEVGEGAHFRMLGLMGVVQWILESMGAMRQVVGVMWARQMAEAMGAGCWMLEEMGVRQMLASMEVNPCLLASGELKLHQRFVDSFSVALALLFECCTMTWEHVKRKREICWKIQLVP